MCVLLPEMSAATLFSITVASIALCGSLVASYTGGLFSVVGQLPGGITQTVVAGQGLAGCVVSMVSFITIALGPEDEFLCSDEDEDDEDDCSAELDYSALAFFITCCMVGAVAIICYSILEKLPATM